MAHMLNVRVLVVDDDTIIRRMIKDVLMANRIQTFEAANGAEALVIIAKGEMDLVIADLTMPKMTGIEMVKRVRKEPNPKSAQVPILILTALGKDVLRQCRQAGASDVLEKPISIKDLMDVVVKYLGDKAGPLAQR